MKHPIRIDPSSGLITISSNICNQDKYNCLKDHWFFTIPGFDNYALNRNGEIINKSTKNIRLKQRWLVLYNHKKYSSLVLCDTMIDVFDSMTESDYPITYYIDNDKDNFKLNNLIRYRNIEEVIDKQYPGCVRIGDTDYCINIKGDLYRIETDTKLLWQPGKRYYRCRLHDGSVIFQHRILSEMFIPIPERLNGYDYSTLIVHHKNDNKRDNRIDLNDLYGDGTNLEWMTIAEHMSHHSSINRSKAVPILIRDILSNQESIIKYDAIIDAAKAISVTSGTIEYAIRSQQLVRKRYQVKYTDDSSPWPKVKYWIATNINTGEIVKYTRQKSLAEYLGLHTGTISTLLYSNSISKNGWKFKIQSL